MKDWRLASDKTCLELLTFVDLGAVEAVEDGVEHDLGVVAVRVGLGAEAVRVGDDAAVLADDRVGRRLGHVLPPLRHPRPLKEVLRLAERLVVRRGGVETCRKKGKR